MATYYRKGDRVRVAHTPAERVQLEWEGYARLEEAPKEQQVEQASATPAPELPAEPDHFADDYPSFD